MLLQILVALAVIGSSIPTSDLLLSHQFQIYAYSFRHVPAIIGNFNTHVNTQTTECKAFSST